VRFPYRMFTLQTSFKPSLLGGGGREWGVKSVGRGDCEYQEGKLPVKSKNLDSVHLDSL
jgi:hypothetical protein